MENNPLQALRSEMRRAGITAIIVPSSDPHGSEYLHPHDAVRAYFSGFTGSAGTLVVLQSHAALFTDGRYFLQAEAQLAGSGIALMREGEQGTPTLPAYLLERLEQGDVVGLDVRLLNAAAYRALRQALNGKGIVLNSSFRQIQRLINDCWPHRPPLPTGPVFAQPLEYAGQSAQRKLMALRGEMRQSEADTAVITSLDSIAWLYNLRGGDIPHNPVAFCYAAVRPDTAYLFIQQERLQPTLRAQLAQAGVTLRPYDDIYGFVQNCAGRVLLDSARVNYALYALLEQSATIIEAVCPVMLRKAVKNDAELNGMRAAHVKDGVVMVRFLKYLRERVGKQRLTECDAAEKLRSLRGGMGALGESFPAIVGYGAHAAVVHYAAAPESDAPLLPRGLLLVDSGGQYREGTTDVTRTIPLGPVTPEEKQAYTLVLQGMLRFAAAKFPAGLRGDQLDVLARQPLWNAGLNYSHGTSHGIGSFLCVHEPPIRVNYRVADTAVLQPGMVLSDEPGVYREGEFGVRMENQICVREAALHAADTFLCFETLTLAPIDTAAIEKSLLSPQDTALLNAYHARVYETLRPHLTAEEQVFLRGLTDAI